MTKTYYKNEYSESQWRALIDKALVIGCAITYSIYGSNAEIDSTATESRILLTTGKSINDSAARCEWAYHIHDVLLPKAAAAAK